MGDVMYEYKGLDKHIKTMKADVFVAECKKCGKKFVSLYKTQVAANLNQHLITHRRGKQ